MNFKGPPNKGKILTPVKKSIDVGKIMATVGGGVVDAAPKTSSVKKEEKAAKATPKPVADKVTPAAPMPTVDDQYESPPIVEASAAPPAPTKPTTFSKVPVSTITVGPSSANAPAPTEASCPKGWKCVTVTDVEVVTTTIYVTATAL
jgi:hypothetical protein